MYLLDTNPCIEMLRNQQSPERERLAQHDPSEIYLCAVVKAELFYGARKSAQIAKNLRLVRAFCAPFVSLPFDDHCAEHYGMIRADLERIGLRIGANDLVIAAIAKSHDLILVTHNTDEFSRVPGLQLEDWHSGSQHST
jgi:tRNA(fMet)-specific endonuclease VapC